MAVLELTPGDWALGGRTSVRAKSGMVAAAHPLAANAGAQMLRQGGNAFDAVAATAAALNVVEPFMSGLAGAGAATFYDAAKGKVGCVDFIPPAPAGLQPDTMDTDSTLTGPLAPCTPGNLAGWHALQSRFGKLNFSDVLQPAIKIATEGFPISAFFIVETSTSVDRITDSEWQRVFRVHHDWQPGEILTLPDLAGTLEAIAAKGIEHLYGGALGERMAQHLAQVGGVITLDDLSAVKPVFETPLNVTYRNRQIYVPPPPAESFQKLLALRILDSFDLAQMGLLSVDHLDHVFRAIRVAAGIRIRNNRCSPEQAQNILDDVSPLVVRVADGRPIDGPTEFWTGDSNFDRSALKEHTTSMSVADGDGNMVCLTQSLGSPYGSGVMIPGTGIVLNNFLNWSDLDPSSPNAVRPGERIAMCLAPSISTLDDQAVLALGTPGSYGILQTQVQAMVGYVDFGLDLQAAIDMPRARLWDGTTAYIERRVPHDTCQALAARGHDVRLLPEFSWRAGGLHAVARDPLSGGLTGAADSRRDGAAIPA